MSDLNDAGFWRQLAKEACGIAEAMALLAAQREMPRSCSAPCSQHINETTRGPDPGAQHLPLCHCFLRAASVPVGAIALSPRPTATLSPAVHPAASLR